jgi:diguanylate cyclase (GGDEF)-like protein
MDMSAIEWWWAVGQTLLVTIIVFVLLCAATSWVRFQMMSESTLESEELGSGADRNFRTAVMNRIALARRERQPISVVLLQMLGDLLPAADLVNIIQPWLRSGDSAMVCGDHHVGLLLLCGSEKSESAVRRMVELAGSANIAGADRWHFGVAGYPEHGFKTSVLYSRAMTMAQDAASAGQLIAGMAPAEAVAEDVKTPSELVDPLTGLIREDKMIGVLRRYIAQERRANRPVSLIYLDVDQFERIREIHGENISNELIKELAGYIESNTRESDILARFGSNGFIVAMPVSPSSAMTAATRLVQSIRKIAFKSGRGIKITLSAGISGYPDVVGTAVQYFVAAEAALKNAKLRGRNQCVKYDPTMPLRTENEAPVERL